MSDLASQEATFARSQQDSNQYSSQHRPKICFLSLQILNSSGVRFWRGVIQPEGLPLKSAAAAKEKPLRGEDPQGL
jgi:hypothetical protein